ncbi:MAG: helix-turn-helix transcriptional regulator [Ruminococcaceae bacterium]|nr:helix-turn-helix transcriptional regulator [Oscillospiraceae bacterium]
MLGQRINELRKERGWSQVDLAKKLSITKQTVSNWENDNIQPSIEMLVRLSKIFAVSTDYMLGLDDSPRLNVDGLPTNVVAHLSLLIDDFRKQQSLQDI